MKKMIPNDRLVSFRLPEHLLEKLRRAMKLLKVARSEALRMALEAWKP